MAAEKVTLIIIPCAATKIWKNDPAHGAAPARDAYTSDAFKKNRAYAERFSSHWRILSAKYGFIEPDFLIPQDYNVTFNDPATNPIRVSELRSQILGQHLHRFPVAIALGPRKYAETVCAAFAITRVRLVFPYLGLRPGEAKSAVMRAVEADDPLLPYIPKRSTMHGS